VNPQIDRIWREVEEEKKNPGILAFWKRFGTFPPKSLGGVGVVSPGMDGRRAKKERG